MKPNLMAVGAVISIIALAFAAQNLNITVIGLVIGTAIIVHELDKKEKQEKVRVI